ncbi:MAG: DnaJ domain-containing protein [Snowella sp.]|nr:DnaJ domain-containing protein [Snowella sp.]
MGQFHEISYFLKVELPFKKVIDIIIESARKIHWPNPGHGQQAKTFFEKIDYKQGKILIRKKDPQGKPLKNPYLTNELIIILLKEQTSDQYQILIRSESPVSLPLGHNYDNVVTVKNEIIYKNRLFQLTHAISPEIHKKSPPNPPKMIHYPHNDPYRILGIKPNATASEVTEAYLQAIRNYHPDKLMGLGMAPEFIQLAEQRTKEINAAYEVLKQQLSSQ